MDFEKKGDEPDGVIFERIIITCGLIAFFRCNHSERRKCNKINQYDQSLQQTIDFYEEHMITYIELLGQIAQAISP